MVAIGCYLPIAERLMGTMLDSGTPCTSGEAGAQRLELSAEWFRRDTHRKDQQSSRPLTRGLHLTDSCTLSYNGYVKPTFFAWGCIRNNTVEAVDGQINQTPKPHARSPPPRPLFQFCISEHIFCCQGFDMIRPLKPTSFTNMPTLNYGG